MTADPAISLLIRRATADDLPAAYAWLFSTCESKFLVNEIQAAALKGQIYLSEMLVACRGSTYVGMAWGYECPGRMACVYGPHLAADEPDATGVALLEHAHAILAPAAPLLLHAVCERAEGREHGMLIAAGYTYAAHMHILYCDLREEFPESATELEYVPYHESEASRLVKIVDRTYLGTLDCPQLNGLRATADVLAGYRATGVWAPERWLLVRRHGNDIGCLLLADHPETNHWELVYMGLVPEARGKGLAMSLVRHAQVLGHAMGRETMFLGVDAANDPAIRLYTKAGFLPYDERHIFLCRLERLECAPHFPVADSR